MIHDELHIPKEVDAEIVILTLGKFKVWRLNELITDKDWGRDATLQLFQYLITSRNRKGQHREKILDRLWPDLDNKSAEQQFKVALHGINKVLEPNRKKRTEPRYILRQGVTYQLNMDLMWVDLDYIEANIALGNQLSGDDNEASIEAYKKVIPLHEGTFLPNRIYEDWSSEERERIQLLILGGIIDLCDLINEISPSESLRLSQKALLIDHAWEDAYRVQMAAYHKNGNRPMVIKTYKKCEQVLENEFGIDPLPETRKYYELAIGNT